MYSDVVKLISIEKIKNKYGDLIETPTERPVYVDVKSIGQTEFYQAQAIGLRPEIKFVLADYLDYQGEKKLKFQGYNDDSENEYEIIRTYRTNNQLELICRRGIE